MESVLSLLVTRTSSLILMIGAIFLSGIGFSSAASQNTECTSGKLSANLIGWSIEGKMPHGSAEFSGGKLNVSLTSVNMEDGTKLLVFMDDSRIGELPALKGGATETVFEMPKVNEGAYLMIKSGEDRPIVSASLACKSK